MKKTSIITLFLLTIICLFGCETENIQSNENNMTLNDFSIQKVIENPKLHGYKLVKKNTNIVIYKSTLSDKKQPATLIINTKYNSSNMNFKRFHVISEADVCWANSIEYPNIHCGAIHDTNLGFPFPYSHQLAIKIVDFSTIISYNELVFDETMTWFVGDFIFEVPNDSDLYFEALEYSINTPTESVIAL